MGVEWGVPERERSEVGQGSGGVRIVDAGG